MADITEEAIKPYVEVAQYGGEWVVLIVINKKHSLCFDHKESAQLSEALAEAARIVRQKIS